MLGYWVQNAFVGDHQLFRIEHSTSPKEQALMFERMTDIVVMPIDRDLDGRYDMFLLLSVKTQKLIDVLVLTDDGWLRHSTEEEFAARQKTAEENKRVLKEADQIIQDALGKGAKEMNK